MKRTKLVYGNKNEDLKKKVQETLKKYHIKESQLIEVKYTEQESTNTALIIYNA
mgnify:CR=1 FL=1